MSDCDRNNICKMVVANNLCIGCGLCAGVCPQQNLKIEFNEYGEYVAVEKGVKCADTCDICLQVCPFADKQENEDTLGERLFADIPGVKHTPQTGYYLKAFVGYSGINGHRELGASGGIATWMLETLLKENRVDYVACVSPTNDPKRLFKFQVCTTAEEVRSCSRSCYYPVELSKVIQYILSHEGRYALIALPCFCKALRLAMQVSPKLRDRVKFVLGLVCGQTKSKFFAEYICALGGGAHACLNHVMFRVKAPNRPASDFGMKFTCGAGANPVQEGVVFWTEGIDPIWNDRYFTPNSCDFCDDVFAELADVCFMDAWLPQYSCDWRGHNIILVRNKLLCELLEMSAKKDLLLNNLDIRDVIRSQQGVLDSKRDDMRERIFLAEKEGLISPQKRTFLCRDKLSFERKLFVRAKYLISQSSRREWTAAGKNLPRFQARLNPHIIRLQRARLLKKVMRIPKKIIRRLRKVLR